MFSSVTVALLMALGVGAWAYNKMYRANGGLTRNALITGGAAALGAFILVLTLMAIFFKK